MTTRAKFPRTLNVTVENEGEGEDEYLDPNGTLEEKASTSKERLVAVYELKEIITLKAKVVIEPYKGE